MKAPWFFLCCAWVAASLTGAATLQEDFSTDPASKGWRVFGDTHLFQWDATNQNLRVTWDSSLTNSYFYHPLGTVLARDDDFALSFDLAFQDYLSGTTPGRPFAFPAAIGFLNLDNATRTNFARGSGVNATYGPKNLVEFNFFPAFGAFLPTIAQVIISTNNVWLFNHDNLLDMPPGEVFHIGMDYSAVTQTLTTRVSRNDVPYGQVQTITVPANFDFRAAAVSVSSYSDQRADGSLLAHGIVDNFAVTFPDPPVGRLTAVFTNNLWQVAFASRSNWVYALERTTDFLAWESVGPGMSGTGEPLLAPDTNPLPGGAFYRIRAERP